MKGIISLTTSESLLAFFKMASRKCVFLIFSLFSICLTLANSIKFNYPAVFNFGDSNSDTGDIFSAGIEALYPPYGEKYFHRRTGRYCDGRLIVDFLSKNLNHDAMFCFIPLFSSVLWLLSCFF